MNFPKLNHSFAIWLVITSCDNQPDGKGKLWMGNGTMFTPNDKVKLAEDVFRLYYQSQCEDAQQVDIYIEDNFNQEQKYTFEWTNETIEEDIGTE